MTTYKSVVACLNCAAVMEVDVPVGWAKRQWLKWNRRLPIAQKTLCSNCDCPTLDTFNYKEEKCHDDL